jgi:hypothetical protein
MRWMRATDRQVTRSISARAASSNPASPTEEKKASSAVMPSSKYIGQPLYPIKARSNRQSTAGLADGIDGLGLHANATDGDVSNKAVNFAVNPRFGQIAIGTEK